MNIISLDFTHIQQLLTIENTCFPTPWSMDTIKWALSENDIHGVGLQDGNTIVGYGFLRHSIIDGKPYEQADLLNIAVTPTYRGLGYGKILLSHLMNLAWSAGAEQIFLEVRLSNEKAQGLYASLGFRSIGTRKGYYANLNSPLREDGVVMMAEKKDG